ncbi:hypothetical protein DFP72DRAFT_942246 [Ephemerocybe angulata]|uniref:Uncharacterized protein n=1 Tax=Ephemerocybe angulata TaxID=980116 RepID=A0A8H6H842_9AGAR|nr:hypothetical protein DFP72DRAFT_942246 [Tulosesus angulatus]
MDSEVPPTNPSTPFIVRQRKLWLQLSATLVVLSLAVSLPYLASTSLFQSPFATYSTIKFIRTFQHVAEQPDTPEASQNGSPREHGGGPANEQDPPSAPVDIENMPLLRSYAPMQGAQSGITTLPTFTWRHHDQALHLCACWLGIFCLEAFICAILTIASTKTAEETFPFRLWAAWTQAGLDLAQSGVMAILSQVSLLEMQRRDRELTERYGPEPLCTLGAHQDTQIVPADGDM